MNIKDRVSIELKDRVADVRLIRADKMNAPDLAMFEGIIDAGAAPANLRRARSRTGRGKAFCAGLDMELRRRERPWGPGRTCRARATSPRAPRHRQPAAAMRQVTARSRCR